MLNSFQYSNQQYFPDIHSNELALLVIAYLRPDNLEFILDTAIDAGVKIIYISIDYPKNPTKDNLELHNQVISVARKYRNCSQYTIHIVEREFNVGCSAAVLSSCDWFFNNVEKGIVLEDDCIPTSDFFEYCRDALKIVQNDEGIWIACGTQFAPRSLSHTWVLSKYPLTWGWATTSIKWKEMSASLRESEGKLPRFKSRNISFPEAIYWDAGALRATRGISDAWDTPLVQKMLLNSKLAILPNVSLVSNIGNDEFATHTHGSSIGLKQETGKYTRSDYLPIVNTDVDYWLKKRFYRIRIRHILTTRVTYLIDALQSRNRHNLSLESRWENAKIENYPL